ncbi:MAG: MBOAT family protein, partial [Clostridia bacterium]|nr:MBOAT family protein [Clostridia bacterium]
MLFNSLNFLIFFPTVTLLYFLLPYKLRWLLLLIASCVFYMAFIPKYILILAFTITMDYVLGLLLEKNRGNKKYLLLSLISNIGVLFVFKYFNFFNSSIADIAAFFNWNYSYAALSLILPIGLSFHTFQSLSYVIEVYRGNQQAERNFGIFALYVMFYPQLVAGPIERPQNLLHQFYERHRFELPRVSEGLRMMLWGLFKKVVIADRLAILVNPIYNDPDGHGGFAFLVATVFFAFQIYCDFSGYSDIARGAAKVMGFRLMLNFDRPYFSRSIAEFWKRWHISLSSWFRDYVYIPLGGNRVKRSRWHMNLLITFLLSGLWHGANWTFVIWGGLNGAYLVLSLLSQNLRHKLVHAFALDRLPRLHRLLQVAITFGLICLAWVFFRANSFADALYMIRAMCCDLNAVSFAAFIAFVRGASSFGMYNLLLSLACIVLLLG